MNNYKVYCGNIGMVHEGESRDEAMLNYFEYVDQSKSGLGRAANEDVAIFEDDELIYEHIGTNKKNGHTNRNN